MIRDHVSYPAFSRLVGRTPLVRLSAIDADLPHRLWAKCEFMNPLGSVKDRIVTHIVDRAEQTGLLRPGATIVEATGGNTGLALAAIAATRGYRVVVTMSEKMSADKAALLRAWGAEVMICPYGVPPDSPDSFVGTAAAIAAATPGSYYMDQFNNPLNAEAHYLTTGRELWENMHGRVSAVVAGVGTGGTLMGAARYLTERDKSVRVVLADPMGSILADVVTGKPAVAKSYLVEGIGGDFVPGLLDPGAVTDVVTIADHDAFAMCLRLQRDEGLFVGGSAGCAVAAARSFARDLPGPPADIAVILPDSGTRAVSTIYSDQWRQRHGLNEVGCA